MGWFNIGGEKLKRFIDSDSNHKSRKEGNMGFGDTMRVMRGGVDDVVGKLKGNPQRTVVQLTAHGKQAVNDEGVDGLKGQVLGDLEDKGSRTISQLSVDCQVPVMTIKRIVRECAQRNPPLVQVN